MPRILVVDDEPSMREMLEILLGGEGLEVELAADEASALKAFAARQHDLVLTDLKLGARGSGLKVLEQVKQLSPETEVIVMTAFSTDEAHLRAMKLGAYGYLPKSVPFNRDEYRLQVEKALEKRSLARDNAILRDTIAARNQLEGMLGRSDAMREVFALVQKVGPSRSTVLVTGESGVGKELVARAVHARSPRASAQFIAVNCGAIPEGLIESELFGHVKGAFTGAQTQNEGLFRAATGGTIFLDEIGELPLTLQVKLLRALQERRIRPVGGTEDVEVDVRVIAATNRDLAGEVRNGRFREDLYYRLNVIQIRVPPLRERREDVLLLADHFLRRFAAEAGRPGLVLSAEARRRLDGYTFPGNVRELENFIERAVTLADGPEVTVDALPAPLRPVTQEPLAAQGPLPEGFSLEAHLADIEKTLIDRAMAQAGGVKKNAAKVLGITFRQFRHRWKKLSGEPEGAGDDAADEA